MKRGGPAVWKHRTPPPSNWVFIDPRIALARHIDWQKTYDETEFSLPEPDNFNFATLSQRPLFCESVKNQVWYQDFYKSGWISLYLVTPQELPAFKDWLKQQPWRSYWRTGKPLPLRTRRSMLWNRRTATELTLEERLYLSGYYKNFIAKYFADGHAEFVYRRLGEPRGRLIDWEESQDDTSREESLYDF